MGLVQAITRLILSGVLDRFPGLRLLLAHSGGVLPQLSSRLASCIEHDPQVASRLKHDARVYMGMLWYDAVAYGSEELEFVAKVVNRGEQMAPDTKKKIPFGDASKGSRRILFGTDFPFFPPLESEDDKWMSVTDNLAAIDGIPSWTDEDKQAVKGGNAIELFDLSRTSS
jgi:aminocarboxymuconate-semialdehyde decarboxylase